MYFSTNNLVLFQQFFQSPHASLRKLSLGSVNQYIMLMPAVSMPKIFALQYLVDLILMLLEGDLVAGIICFHGSISSRFVCSRS